MSKSDVLIKSIRKTREARMTQTSNLGRLTGDLRYVKLSLKKSVPMRY